MKATSNRLRAMTEHSQPFLRPSPPGNPQSKISRKKLKQTTPENRHYQMKGFTRLHGRTTPAH
jgi:hypothetical protein